MGFEPDYRVMIVLGICFLLYLPFWHKETKRLKKEEVKKEIARKAEAEYEKWKKERGLG